jgi:hypothetical protein
MRVGSLGLSSPAGIVLAYGVIKQMSSAVFQPADEFDPTMQTVVASSATER